MSGTHAICAPSKVDIWGHCFGALAYAKHLPESPPTIDSAKGTCTHTIGERIANNLPIPKVGDVEEHDGFKITIDQDRIDRAQHYVDGTRAFPGIRFYEVKLQSRRPQSNGTSDCVIADIDNHHLSIHDLKDGHGVIFADSEQLLCYLIDAWRDFEYLDDFQTFSAHIHQPRQKHYDEKSYTKAELIEAEERLTRAARRSLELLDEPNPKKVEAALNPSDKACQWCPRKGNCVARERSIVEQFPMIVEEKPLLPVASTLSNEQLATLLKHRSMVEDAFKAWAGEALIRANRGEEIPGWKLVYGRAGNREWLDPKAMDERLYELLQSKAYTKKLVSPAQAEKLLKKCTEEGALQLLADMGAKDSTVITRTDPSVSLVPMSDRKAALSLDIPEFQDQTGSDLI